LLKLENEIYLYLLLAVPFLILLYLYYRARRKKALARFATETAISRLAPNISTYKNSFKFILLLVAFSLLVLGLANPQIGTKMKKVKREGVEIVLAVDVSNSMLAEDIKPNRLERAKFVIKSLIDKLKQDKLSIVLFAGDSFLQLPMTTDYGAAKLMVSAISTDMIEKQGTAIGSAIELGMKSFSDDPKVSKVMIIITDGENHEDDALSAAKEAKDKGITLHTVGMGSINGGPIPLIVNGTNRGYLTDNTGQTVVTKLNANMLQELAETGGGRFVQATDGNIDLSQLLGELSKMHKTQFEAKIFTDFEDRFQYALLAALAVLILEALIIERKNKTLTLRRIVGEKND
jgi:Ca-activated chloride channel family protein